VKIAEEEGVALLSVEQVTISMQPGSAIVSMNGK
jgi:hypothetical protein